MVDIRQAIWTSFPQLMKPPVVSDAFIESHPHIMMDLEDNVDHFKIVPAYMDFIVRHKSANSLVEIYTLHTLAEYGRAKNTTDSYLNFKFRCTQQQVAVIIQFLNWCRSEIPAVDETSITRALTQWQKVAKN